jgi:predicted ArsR family transcriptional regulator
MPLAELEAVLRDVGRRTAAELGPMRGGDLRTRVWRAADLLEELGGVAEVEENGEEFVIRGYCCPLSAVVADRPEICLVAEALLEEVIDAQVREECGRGDPPRCAFRVATAA